MVSIRLCHLCADRWSVCACRGVSGLPGNTQRTAAQPNNGCGGPVRGILNVYTCTAEYNAVARKRLLAPTASAHNWKRCLLRHSNNLKLCCNCWVDGHSKCNTKRTQHNKKREESALGIERRGQEIPNLWQNQWRHEGPKVLLIFWALARFFSCNG